MKKNFYLLAISFASTCFGHLYAQGLDSTSNQIAMATTSETQNEDKLAISQLNKQVSDLVRELKDNTEKINMLMNSKDLDAQNRYTVVKENLERATNAYKLLHTKIQSMKITNRIDFSSR